MQAGDGGVVGDTGDPLKEEDIAQVVNLAVQTRRAQRVSHGTGMLGERGGGGGDRKDTARLAWVRRRATSMHTISLCADHNRLLLLLLAQLSHPSTSGRTAAATGLEDNLNDLQPHDENYQPVNGAAAGSMRPPLPRPSSAAPAASGLRQTGLREMFGAPAHPTKSGGLALTASSPAASAASRGGRAGRGGARSSRAGAGRGRGGKAASGANSQAGKRKRKAAVVEEEEDDEEDEDMEAELAAALEEGISEDEEEALPASKRARGGSQGAGRWLD